MRKVNAAIVGFALMLTLVVADKLTFRFNATASVVVIVATVVSVVLIRREDGIPQLLPAVLFVMAAGFMMMSVRQYQYIEAAENISDGETRTYAGYISDLPQYDSSYVYSFKIDTANGEKIDKYEIKAYSYECLDADLYYRFEGDFAVEGDICYFSIGEGEQLTFYPTQSRDVKYWLCILRRNVDDILHTLFDGEILDFVKAVVLGDTVGLSYSTQNAANTSGLAHIIVVSGLHLSIVSRSAFYVLMFLTGAKRKLSSAVSAFVVVLFMGISGFTPSIMRAGICTLLYILSNVIDEDTSPYNSLGMAIIITGIIDPWTVSGKGFMLSTFSILGINFIGNRLFRFITDRFNIPKPLRKMTSAVCVTVGAQLGVLPVLLTMSDTFSLVAVVSNLAIVSVIDILMFCAILGVSFAAMGIFPVAAALGSVTAYCAEYCIKAINFFGGLNYLTVGISGYIVTVFGILCCVVAVLSIALGKMRTGALVCSMLILLCSSINCVVRNNCVTFRITDGGCYVCDSDGNIVAVSYDNSWTAASETKNFISSCGRDTLAVMVSFDEATLIELFNDIKPSVCVTDEYEVVDTVSGDETDCVTTPCTISLSGVNYLFDYYFTVITVGDFVITIYRTETDDVFNSDIAVFATGGKYESDDVYMLINDSLAGSDKKMYNVNQMTVTVFNNGRYILREG